MAGVRFSLCLVLVSACCFSLLGVGSSREHGEKHVLLGGDLVLGGLFPLHAAWPNGTCGHVSVPGIQALEAMLFAVDKVNRESSLLPNISLGVHVLDTCMDPSRSVQAAMTFVHTAGGTEDAMCADGSVPLHRRHAHKRPVCVIGPASRQEALPVVAELLGFFKVPQISFSAATSDLVPEFEYLFQSAPSETTQAAILSAIVQTLGWNYVSLVVTDGRYYQQNAQAFQEEAKKSGRGICIASQLRIPHDADSADIDRVVQQLLRYPRAVGVVVFTTARQASSLLAAAKRLGAAGRFVWLGGETWHSKDVLRSSRGESVITLAHDHDQDSAMLKEFAEYFSKLRPHNNRRNPWFGEYWEHHIQCVSESLSQGGAGDPCVCTGEEDVTVSQHEWVRGVLAAVRAVARAAHDMQQAVCPRSGRRPCDVKLRQDTDILTKFIANVTSGEEEEVMLREGGIPRSVCSDPCPAGHRKVSQTGDACCWLCVRCAPGEYLKDDVTCEHCPEGQRANQDLSACEPTNESEDVDDVDS
ncbi:PREDICTED: metabotropic glutamate receptor-like [Branchiostoma belcheri]|uniref:Metabotropic glutamate receptor-like n=1 Tax=Branchiostoma belcheri TaxID=7741 RepID=A0A6P4ZZ41_BRABE|nr:PREDICTED: metabotropic glutamate receptor-like [Branchiostoma belcheri]